MTQIPKATALALILLVILVQPALAYIDPNTGGLLFQWLAIIFGSLSAFFLIFSRQIRMAFARVRRLLSGKRASNPGESDFDSRTAESAKGPDEEA